MVDLAARLASDLVSRLWPNPFQQEMIVEIVPVMQRLDIFPLGDLGGY